MLQLRDKGILTLERLRQLAKPAESNGMNIDD